MKDDRLYLMNSRLVKNEPFSTLGVLRLRGPREKPPEGGTPNHVPSAFQQPFKRRILEILKELQVNNEIRR
jgi:hypothetical protein